MKTIFSTIGISLVLLLFFHPAVKTWAQHSTSDFIIETQEIKQEVKSAQKSPPQGTQNIIKGENFEARIGFNDASSTDYFSIMISDGPIDYGKLYPTNPISRDAEITINPQSSHGFKVFVSENHTLSDTNFANIIPDTSCDRGLCGKTTSASWNENLTYGLGYGCVNILNSPCYEFEKDSFKKFADESKDENREIIMAGEEANAKAKIIYRLNISPSQANSVYSNTINLVALPEI